MTELSPPASAPSRALRRPRPDRAAAPATPVLTGRALPLEPIRPARAGSPRPAVGQSPRNG